MTTDTRKTVEHTLLPLYVSDYVPSNSRPVVMQDKEPNAVGGVVAATVQYKRGRWYGCLTREDLTDGISKDAVWSEVSLRPEGWG